MPYVRRETVTKGCQEAHTLLRHPRVTLEFSLSDDSLILTVRDEGGWLANASELAPDPAWTVLADAGFDDIFYDREGRLLKLVKRFEKI